MKREAQMITVPARAIDVGYANTKFTCERKRVQGQNIIRAGLFPSITGQLQPGASFLHAPGTLGADGCITDVDGVQHFAGLGVTMHLRGIQPRHVMADYCTSPPYLALVHGALHYMLEDEGNPKEMEIEHLTVGLPLNNFDTYRARLIDVVRGRHAIFSPDPNVGLRHVTVMDASVIVQPLGSLYYYGLVNSDFDTSGWNLVIDVGGGTIDFLVAFDKAPNYVRSGAHPESMLACSTAVAKAINPNLQSQFGVVQAIDTAIRDGSESVLIAGEEFEMANYKGVITEVLRRGYEAMLNTVGALEDFQNILICGGGGAVFYDFLCEHYPALRRRLRNGADSTFSNVRGFHVVSEFMREQTTAAR
ncbi:ParM/StbA family protein [Hydrogenophaga sp. PBL-H3]|uniref:ParM/StbA family protein n=1 Tax=Hydrogenophaga sp. PBL-H3 TaxID=434010 RepID=UPI00132015D5|nr:ParM/StbA family protein [Hydrogenophaga sp. PBL-H3]QHE75484.1 hypothetical protein F9Z45_05140 [Hydrogenophaga sp. PBL-H3]QHE79910.1 hypothetical protein F9Z44_05140 [Hydrogenophaga sp. PBL-H3]